MRNQTEHIHIVCRVRCKENAQEETKKHLLSMAEASRKEEGCLYYEIYQDAMEDTVFYFHDGWVDEAAEQAHLKNPALPDLAEKLMPLYAEGPCLTYMKNITRE